MTTTVRNATGDRRPEQPPDQPPERLPEQPPDRPLDLRLVPPAVGAWLAAALAPGAPASLVLAVAAFALCLAMALLAARRPGPPRIAAAALVCAAASAVIASCDAADLHRGPLPALGREHARATVELTVTGDPRSHRPHVRGSTQGPPLVVLEATAERVSTRGGAGGTTKIRNPVLVIAQGPGTARWRALLPSTRLTVDAKLAPPALPGDRIAAVLYVHRPPDVVRPPTTAQQAAGRLRAGLRSATAGLSADARALLPGLVIGDTSRIPPELIEDFHATDLSHLLAVSGANLS